MTMSLKYASVAEVLQTVTVTAPGSAAPTFDLQQNAHNSSAALDSTTTPPFTKCSYFSKALSAGAATIDLTTLTDANGAVDGTNLKVQVAKFKNPTGNAAMTITFGAATGYLLMGTGWKIILLAGQEFTFYGNDATPDITSLLKHIDIAGTGTQALTCFIGMG